MSTDTWLNKKAEIDKEYPISMCVYHYLHTLYQVHSKRQAVSIIILWYNMLFKFIQSCFLCLCSMMCNVNIKSDFFILFSSSLFISAMKLVVITQTSSNSNEKVHQDQF